MANRLLRALLVILGLCCCGRAQTTFKGNTIVQGTGVTINPGSTYTHIYAVFPPQNDPLNASNNTNFKTYVMTKNAIEGVTVPIQWNWVEADTPPTTTPCSPLGTDVCQQDPVVTSYYHIYNWSSVDGATGSAGCTDHTTQSVSQWFCDFPSHDSTGVFKKVNIELYGYGNGTAITPAYVTGPAWATAAGSTYPHQDVLNVVNDGACGNAAAYSGISVPASTWQGDNSSPYSTITVKNWTGHPFIDGDNIWITGSTTSAFNVNGQYGTAQYGGAIHYISSSSFSYVGSGVESAQVINPTGMTAVSGIQSWIVPYEIPYEAAYQAFLKAAIYHFSHLNITNTVTGGNKNRIQTTSQIVYIRPGVARRGEATPICTSDLMSGGSVQTVPAYTADGAVWQAWYTQVNTTVQSANPLMQIMFAIDAGDPASRNALYATQEAGIAVSHSNAVGMYNGFGSQGLANSDIGSFVLGNCNDASTSAPNTNENWGCMFAKYWSGATSITNMPAVPTTVPLELQQADCSNPTMFSMLSTSCVLVTPYGLTLDLRNLYPFATSHYASILELYSQDALLAYDPYFCDPDTTSQKCTQMTGYDWFSTTLPADAQYSFFEAVGQNGTVPSCTSPGCYKQFIDGAQGNH